ncbi:MAG TPA: hypothetical protein VN766_21120 [Stellaceae bacterium]|jgi:hypothetical protein|nr:hypothetical protein [Stellaceae bacterium]
MATESAAEFYRREAARLVRIARDVRDPAIRIELLQVAAQFQALASHTGSKLPLPED